MPDRSILDLNSGKLRQARMNEAILVGSWPTQQELERIADNERGRLAVQERFDKFLNNN